MTEGSLSDPVLVRNWSSVVAASGVPPLNQVTSGGGEPSVSHSRVTASLMSALTRPAPSLIFGGLSTVRTEENWSRPASLTETHVYFPESWFVRSNRINRERSSFTSLRFFHFPIWIDITSVNKQTCYIQWTLNSGPISRNFSGYGLDINYSLLYLLIRPV